MQCTELLRLQLSLLRPPEPPPPLIIHFEPAINPSAPEGTEVGSESWMVLTPLGYKGPLREGAIAYEELCLTNCKGKQNVE
jgi:hypothetical protein